MNHDTLYKLYRISFALSNLVLAEERVEKLNDRSVALDKNRRDKSISTVPKPSGDSSMNVVTDFDAHFDHLAKEPQFRMESERIVLEHDAVGAAIDYYEKLIIEEIDDEVIMYPILSGSRMWYWVGKKNIRGTVSVVRFLMNQEEVDGLTDNVLQYGTAMYSMLYPDDVLSRSHIDSWIEQNKRAEYAEVNPAKVFPSPLTRSSALKRGAEAAS